MIKKLIPLLLVPVILLSSFTNVKAYYTEFPEPVLMRCTCYTAPEGAITASGQEVREGIVASKKDWIGYACVIYENNNGEVGERIAIYEVLDTGGNKMLQNGTAIDVYRYNLEDCYDWIAQYGDYVFVQIFPAEG